MLRHTLVCCAMLLVLGTVVSAHPRGSSDELAELNDHLMALQWLAPSDPEAERLFEVWRDGLREASWAIRRLTDEEDLEIAHPRVIEQIETARRRRRELLGECRRYFASRPAELPTAVVRLGKTLTVEWPDPVLETPLGTRRLVLVELRNETDAHAHVELRVGPGRQVFAWRQSVPLGPGESRHTFVHVAPVQEGSVEGSIGFRRADGPIASLRVRAIGRPGTGSHR